MKIIYVSILFLLNIPFVSAQADTRLEMLNKRLDSLLKSAPSFKNDTLKVLLLAEMTKIKTESVNADSARKDALVMLKLAETIGWKKGQMYGYKMLAQVEGTQSKYYSAIELANKGRAIAESVKDAFWEATFLRILGDAYHWLEKPEKSMHYLNLQLKTNQNDKQNVAATYIDLGDIHTKLKKFDTAKTHIEKGIDLAHSLGNNTFEGYGFAIYGIWAKTQGLYTKAIDYFLKAIALYEKDHSDYLKTDAQNYLAEVYLSQKEYKTAIDFAERAFANAQRLNIYYSERDASKTLYECYRLLGNTPKALEAHINWMKYKDLMSEESTNQKLDALHYEYENKKQQQLIAQQNTENQQQRKNNIWLTSVLGLILIFVAFLWFVNRKLKEKSSEIENYQSELKKLNSELENRVEQRTDELYATQQELFEQESEHRKRLYEVEMTALRAQMNPHFIFNVLNSINNFTLSNNPESASIYLTKFSKLIRLVLENSKSELITLQSELEALRLYIELEAMRFKGKVQYEINVQEDIDQRFVQLPPLLLQPYIENAIWHGLMHKVQGGKVWVNIVQPNENLLKIEIVDNGVGREKARELKSKTATKDKSFGMQITSDRLKILSQLYKIDSQIRIVDLEDGHTTGTKVTIEIPC